MAARMTVQRITVDASRRRKTCGLEGDGVALAGSDMGAKINRRDAKSQRRFAAPILLLLMLIVILTLKAGIVDEAEAEDESRG